MRNGWRCWLAQGDNDGDSDLASGVHAEGWTLANLTDEETTCVPTRDKLLAVVGAGEVSTKEYEDENESHCFCLRKYLCVRHL
jgi:hypothetical protein